MTNCKTVIQPDDGCCPICGELLLVIIYSGAQRTLQRQHASASLIKKNLSSLGSCTSIIIVMNILISFCHLRRG